jgi:MFS family permease
MAMVLLAVFIGANFVAMIFLTWMPSFLFNKFGMTLAMAGLNGTAWIQIFSVLGVLTGGVLADRLARKHRGGRPMTQALGLFLGIPFLFVTGWTMNTGVLVIAMSCYGFSKGMYDANIWASLYDVVPVARRATSVGIMNSVGWMFGSFGPVAIASASQRFGFSACLSATSAIYLLFGVLMTAGIRRYLRNT